MTYNPMDGPVSEAIGRIKTALESGKCTQSEDVMLLVTCGYTHGLRRVAGFGLADELARVRGAVRARPGKARN